MPLPKDSKFVFCMHECATFTEPLHIRVLGTAGPLFDGGVSEPPLCGYHGHWFSGQDVNAELTEEALQKACSICTALHADLEGKSWIIKILSEM
jgi:hypothetical protein